MTKEARIECRLVDNWQLFIISYMESLESIEVIRSSCNFDMASEQVWTQIINVEVPASVKGS